MPERAPTKASASQNFIRDVGAHESRKLRALRRPAHVWSGLGMLGLVGWSVCLPTLLGTWLGLWLDKQQTGAHAWTLALLVAGLCVGCANAWHWVTKEQNAIQRRQGDDE